MTHLFHQRRVSNHFPLCIVLIKGCNCLCYKLSLCIDRLPMLQPLVCLNKEKNIVLRVINDTDISPCMHVFTTNKEWEVHPLVCQSFSMNIIQSLKKLNSKINHGSFTPFGDHGKIKISDQLCMVILLHGPSISIV
jgi:hypothetical protein